MAYARRLASRDEAGIPSTISVYGDPRRAHDGPNAGSLRGLTGESSAEGILEECSRTDSGGSHAGSRKYMGRVTSLAFLITVPNSLLSTGKIKVQRTLTVTPSALLPQSKLTRGSWVGVFHPGGPVGPGKDSGRVILPAYER